MHRSWFVFVVGVALTWHLLGAWAYLAEVTLSAQALAALPEAIREQVLATPKWVIAARAIAVWTGAAGCVGLLLAQRWALPMLILALLGAIAQHGHELIAAQEQQMLSAGTIAMAALSIAMTGLLVWLARSSARAASTGADDSPSGA